MDFDDVSHIKQWFQVLGKQKAALQAASKRKGERPKDRKPLMQLIRQHMIISVGQQMMMMQGTMDQRQIVIHQSWVGPPYPPSKAALKDLKKLFFKDLRLETHHHGFYVLLRAAAPSHLMTAVMTIMEDENGDGVVFQLYQQKADNYRAAEEVIEEGSLYIVKEPYFKVMNDGGYGLRVDHVSDLILLSVDDERVPAAWKPRITELEKNAMELKGEGNSVLSAGMPYKAAQIYTEALEHAKTAEERHIIQLNRSMVNLRTGHFEQALQDAGVGARSRKSEKALYRAARALYELRKFQESHDMLKSLLWEFPDCVDAQRELARTEQRLEEQKGGHYDFKAMYKASQNKPPYIDCATYLGPITVQTSQGRGRGLFTTRAVAAGEMLLCEKAFAYCWASNEANQAGSKTRLLMNTTTERMVMGTQADLITETVQKLYRNSSLIPAFYALHSGDYPESEATTIDGSAVIDTFLVERVITLNGFGCPNTSLQSHFEKPRSPDQQRRDNAFHTSGLFINASYINHSCDSNADRSFIGDMQIIRATRNIPADTEITFWYQAPNPRLSYQQIQEKFKNWDFICKCTICEHIKNTPKKTLSKRNALLNDLEDAFCARPAADLAKAERLLTAISKTYTVPAHAVPRLALWDPYLLLTRIYSAQKNDLKTIETAWKILDALGYVIKREDPASLTSAFKIQVWGLMLDNVVETWIHLWTAYARYAPELCKKAEEYARIAYKICVGEDETFDENYGKLARRAVAGEEANLMEAFRSMAF